MGWEEFSSDDFYWNRMAYVYSLNVAADFADSVGQSGNDWRLLASEIAEETRPHFDGEYIYEAAKTVATYNRASCQEYPINRQLNGQGVPGVLIGRYPGDSYAGGNPWQLLTAAHAELFYLGAEAALKRGPHMRLVEEQAAWADVFGISHNSTQAELAKRSISAGNAVMTRLWMHVKDDGGRVDEQIDKNTGAQVSAQALTWSYANVLHALHTQKRVAKMLADLNL